MRVNKSAQSYVKIDTMRRRFLLMGLWMGWLGFGGMVWAAETRSRIDLEIQNIQIQPPRPTSQTSLVSVASIRNNGSEPSESFYISLTLLKDGRKLKTIENIPVLSRLPRSGSGLSVPVDLGQLESGDYEVIMTADPDNLIEETNEKNNVFNRQFQVVAAGANSTVHKGYQI